MPAVRRGVSAEAGRRRPADLLLEAVPGAVAHRAAEAQGGERPGPGGAGRPFPDDDLILEQLADRIVAEAEERSQFCPWCLARLTNCSVFCSDVCREDYYRKLMPVPHARSIGGATVPSFERIKWRKNDLARAAAWSTEHAT